MLHLIFQNLISLSTLVFTYSKASNSHISSIPGTYTGAQPALHFGGGQFTWNFIRWRHRAYSTVVQIFRKRHR